MKIEFGVVTLKAEEWLGSDISQYWTAEMAIVIQF